MPCQIHHEIGLKVFHGFALSASWGSLDEKTLSDAKQEEHAMQRVGRHSVPECWGCWNDWNDLALGKMMEFSPVCFNGAVFFSGLEKNLKLTNTFASLVKYGSTLNNAHPVFSWMNIPRQHGHCFQQSLLICPGHEHCVALLETFCDLSSQRFYFVMECLGLFSGWPPRWITSFLNVW